MKSIDYFKVILILPGNVLITIPFLIFLLTKKFFSYKLSNFNSIEFYFAVIFFVLGLWLAIWSVKTFYNHGGNGTPGPWKPLEKLVVSGPYRYLRNPMLMGVFFLLLFESLFFFSLPLFCWFIVFLIGNIFYFKKIEEKDLLKRFGSEYANYKKKVPMLYPIFKAYKK